MNGAMTTKQVAEITGCTEHQLRYWDHIGLVRPSVQGTDGHSGKARLYSSTDAQTLMAIRGLRDEGVSLQKIRGLSR